MGSLHRARLARRLAAVTAAAARKVGERAAARANAEAAAAIRAALAERQIDPALLSCLGVVGDTEARLRRLGDTPQLRQADAAFAAAESRSAADLSLAAKAVARSPEFAGRPPPDRCASLLDWYAWSLAVSGGSATR